MKPHDSPAIAGVDPSPPVVDCAAPFPPRSPIAFADDPAPCGAETQRGYRVHHWPDPGDGP